MDEREIKRLNEGEYVSSEYWEGRLEGLFTLRGVGHMGFSETYNKWYYRSTERAMDQALEQCSIPTSGARLLDIGVGTGYYLCFWKRRGISGFTGLDITDKSVGELRALHPDCSFFKTDISEPLTLDLGTFNIVAVFNVLFHVKGDENFETALSNIAGVLADGGNLLIIDNFLAGQRPLTGHHEEHRTLSCYEDALAAAGLEIAEMVPISFIMNTPVNAASVSNRTARLLAVWGFRLNEFVSKVLRKMGNPGEKLTDVWGFILYNVDRAALRVFREAPGQQIAVIRRTRNDS